MQGHTSVLLHEAVAGLALNAGDMVVDATMGLGGHTKVLAEAVGERGTVIAIDVDQNAHERAKEHLKEVLGRVRFVRGNFRDLASHVHREGITHVDAVLFDLGWNSTQLESGRGFSFKSDDPLVMTLEATPSEGTTTAQTLVNKWSEDDLAEIIATLGEERFARRIAHAIVRARHIKPIERAHELARLIEEAVPAFYRNGKTHPATKTFQALRMMVNDELTSLTAGLSQAFTVLAPGGRLAVISFHSLEDGLVKRTFKALVQNGSARFITKKPHTPTQTEIKNNPRARSAKLRIIEKL